MSSKVPFYLKFPTPKQHIYKGICLPGEPLYLPQEEYFTKIRNFHVRDNDVAIMSYLRTGSRWTAERVCWILNDCDEHLLTKKSNFARVMHLEFAFPTNNADILKRMPYSRPRVYSSHLQLELAPTQIEKAKIIIPYRNPKDNAVSLFHHFQLVQCFGAYDGPWEDFLTGYMDGSVMWGSYLDWLRSWCPLHDRENVMFVKYEDSIKDPCKSVKKIAEFLGKNLTEEQVQLIVEKTSFEKMKDSPQTNTTMNPLYTEIYNQETAKFIEFIRKGKVGQWKDYFTVKQNEEFDELIKEKFADIGLDFEYEI